MKEGRGADQQVQTQWRRCVGGLSGYRDNGVRSTIKETVVTASHRMAGEARTGALGCWMRFEGIDELRSAQNWQTGHAGILLGTER